MKAAQAAMKWILAILVPFALVMLGVRVLLSPIYLQIEYRLPGFPPDEYGFTTDERLHWGTFGINYLLNNAPPSYLGDLRLVDGRPVFENKEVSHMRDVQVVVAALMRAWYVVLVVMALLGILAWRLAAFPTFRAGLRLGGLLTLAIAGAAALVGTVGASGSGDLFWNFFSGFHGIFFSGDSWLFNYSDTLIRLYPLRFWQDSVVYLGVLAALGAAGLALGFRDRTRADVHTD